LTAQLAELAQLVRSKNAGPFLLTLDVVFESKSTYDKVVASGVLTEACIAKLYAVPAADVQLIFYPAANAVKATMPRHISAGDLGDSDLYGAQQYPLLAELEVPID
jgi:hypothetical protein